MPAVETSTRQNAQYSCLLRRFSYSINERYSLTYSKQLRLRALRDGAGAFVDKIAWSGGEAGLPECVSDRPATVRPLTTSPGLWDYYQVVFAEPLGRGDEVAFELRWPDLGNWTSSKPFVSTTAHEPVERIRFDVQLPRAARDGDRCWLEELSAPDSPEPLERRPAKFDEHGTLTWEIADPTVGRHYRVAWQWHPIIAAPKAATEPHYHHVSTNA